MKMKRDVKLQFEFVVRFVCLSFHISHTRNEIEYKRQI